MSTEFLITARATFTCIRRETGVVDAKGRKIGCMAEIRRSEWSRNTSALAYGYSAKACEEMGGCMVGLHARINAGETPVTFEFSPRATRDGKSYGASHRATHFATEAEALVAAEAYFARTIARRVADAESAKNA